MASGHEPGWASLYFLDPLPPSHTTSFMSLLFLYQGPSLRWPEMDAGRDGGRALPERLLTALQR